MQTKNKIRLLLSFVCIFIFSCYSWSDVTSYKPTILQENTSFNKKSRSVKLKYILQWTDPKGGPGGGVIKYIGEGQDGFLRLNCPVNNCYITANRSFFKELTDFDAIVFHGPDLSLNSSYVLLKTRLPYQKYIFASWESSARFPMYQKRYEDFFNWTWTYKLNSDIPSEYIKIRNKEGNVIGPNQTMNWLQLEQMEPINDELKQELSQKNLFAAWFVTNCRTINKRELYVMNILNELKKYENSTMIVDVFGRCGNKICPRSNHSYCENLVKKFYFFYLSFENSFAEDYVSEKLLTALQNNAVPVVFGGADYSRFMPDGAYLDARKLSPEKLVQKMLDINNDNEKYYDFFRWKNYYTYHDPGISAETNKYCIFCSKINSETDKFKVSSHSNFRNWWNI